MKINLKTRLYLEQVLNNAHSGGGSSEAGYTFEFWDVPINIPMDSAHMLDAACRLIRIADRMIEEDVRKQPRNTSK